MIDNSRSRILRRTALFAAIVVASVSWVLYAAYQQAWRGSEERLRGVAQLIARGIEGDFREADYVLRDVIGHIAPERIRFPDPDPRHRERVRQLLRDKAASLPYIYGIGIMDAECVVAYAAREAPGFNLGKRPLCQAMREAGGGDTYVSGVYLGQQGFLQLTRARKIFHPDGKLAGAALMRMDMGFFAGWLSNIDIGTQGSVALLDLDLNLAARRPEAWQALGKPIDEERLRRFVAENRQEAFHRLRSPVDAVERLYVVRRIEGLPLLVVLGLSTEEAFAEWRSQALWFLVGSLALLGVSALATRHYLKVVQQGDALGWRSLAIDASGDAIVITDEQGTIEYVNPAFTAMTGYPASEAIGNTPRLLKSGEQDENFYRRLWTTILAGDSWRGEMVNRRKDGSRYCDQVTISPVRDAKGGVVRFLAIHRDISERKRMEADLSQLAHFDRLTGLPNRALFFDRVERAIVEARRAQHGFSVLYLDLDGFKAVNDQHGHEAGDALLREVANRLAACVRESDTVGRLGGDEFAVLLRTTNRQEDAAAVAQKIVESLVIPLVFPAYTCRIGASVGVALHPDDGVNVESLLRNADMAMYEAKRRGKNCWVCASDLT